MKRRILSSFGRAQRPIAWTILVGGIATFFAVLLNIIATGQAKVASLLGAVLVVNDGFQAVQEVENELDTDAAAEAVPNEGKNP